MTYFHTGTRTIIGAEAFHCPVRDGKEWDHLAMVIRRNLLLGCFLGTAWRIHRVWNQFFCIFECVAWHNNFDRWIKVIGSSRTSN